MVMITVAKYPQGDFVGALDIREKKMLSKDNL
jgi:hypothetical protein